MTSVERVIEYIDLEPEESPFKQDLQTMSPQWPQGGIVFDNVSFRYSSTSPWVLNKINISIKRNEKVTFSVWRIFGEYFCIMLLGWYCWSNRCWKEFNNSSIISYG